MKKLLPINKVLYFKVDDIQSTATPFFVVKEIQLNEKYRELNKVTTKSVEYHFDIGLEKKDILEYVKFNINITGDIKKNNIDFLPQMLDPKNTEYKNNQIYFTNKFKISLSYTFLKELSISRKLPNDFLDEVFFKFI